VAHLAATASQLQEMVSAGQAHQGELEATAAEQSPRARQLHGSAARRATTPAGSTRPRPRPLLRPKIAQARHLQRPQEGAHAPKLGSLGGDILAGK